MGRRTSGGVISQNRRGPTPNAGGPVMPAILIAALASAMLWIVALYASGLRDPRYLDGWLLAGGMGLQIYFHIATKANWLTPRSATRWRKFHIILGFLLIAVFVSHTNFTLPDTVFEWALWTAFVLVAVSGVFGTYLAWSLGTRRMIESGLTYDRIPARIEELAASVAALVTRPVPNPVSVALPAPAYDAWIADLYTHHLQDFFKGPRNWSAHLIGGERHLHNLTDEIDSLARYVDKPSEEKLAKIRTLVIEKDRADFAHVYLGLGRGWQLVHVPVTYALLVLTLVHVVVAYAHSSGDW